MRQSIKKSSKLNLNLRSKHLKLLKNLKDLLKCLKNN